MLHLSTILKHYKRRDIQEAMINAAVDREVAVKFGDKGFGKRPDVLLYPNDIIEFAKQGATSFHVSEEHWRNVMQINTGMRKQELDALRKGWDLVIDVDCIVWNYSKLISHFVVQELKAHGINSISAKFSGNKGFHIGVPFGVFPRKVRGQPLSFLFPEGVRRIALYLTEKIKPKILKHIKQHDSFSNIASQLGFPENELYKSFCYSCKKIIKEQKNKIEFICLHCESKEEGTEEERYRICKKCSMIMKRLETSMQLYCPYCRSTHIGEELDISSLMQIDTVLISSRHLYRMPYSLHESSGLCSLPLNPEKILEFEKVMAQPEKVSASFSFLSSPHLVSGEGEQLLYDAFDFIPEKDKKEDFEVKKYDKSEEEIQQEAIPPEFFPPCIKSGFDGLRDGKKRFLFIALNFLLSCGYNFTAIDIMFKEWNKKNPEQLREVFLKGQQRYAQQTKKRLPPPNCDNKGYYADIGICKPDNICAKIKNPVQYAKYKLFIANLKRGDEKKESIHRQRLTEEQKAMRRAYRQRKTPL